MDTVNSKEAKIYEAPHMDFSYFLPVNIIFGCGKVKQAGEIASAYGKRALIVTGRSSAKKSGIYDKVKDSLRSAGIVQYYSIRFTKSSHYYSRRRSKICKEKWMRCSCCNWWRKHNGLCKSNSFPCSK